MVTLKKAFSYLHNLILIFEEMAKLFLFLQPNTTLSRYLRPERSQLLHTHSSLPIASMLYYL